MAVDNVPLNRPPSYEATTRNPSPENAVGSPGVYKGSVDEKEALHKGTMDSNLVLNSAYVGGEKSSLTGESRPQVVNHRPNLDVKQLSRINIDMAPGNMVDKLLLFEMGPEKILALTTVTSIQVYNANDGNLLWKVDSNSPQLDRQFQHVPGLRVSPDGTVICATVREDTSRELFVFDTRTGCIKSSYTLDLQDVAVPCISPDNSLMGLFHWSLEPGGVSFLKTIRVDEKPTDSKQYPFKRLQLLRGVGMSFAPDSRHIITIEGPGDAEADSTNLMVSISIYDDWNGSIVSTVERPGPSKPGFLQQIAKFQASVLFPNADQWLVSFPDYHEPDQTCILNARTGETLVSVASDRNLSQWWQAGMLPSMLVSIACHKESGVFTRTEINDTIIPRGKTVTITRFTITGARLRQKAIREHTGERWSRVKVVKMGVDDKCYLSSTGLQLAIVKTKTQQCDIMALPL